MTIATASAAQLSELSNFVVTMRALVSVLSINMTRMNALMQSWTANVQSIVGTPAGLTVTDSTGLAGAVPLTDTQVSTLVGDVQALLASYNTSAAQQLYALVCGPTNITG